MSEAEMLALGLDFAAAHTPDMVERLADWLDGRGVTPDQMHAALTASAVKRQKALKGLADDAAFGPEE